MRKRIGIAVISSIALIGGGIWAHAQQIVPNNPRLAPPAPVQPAQIISGADIGFRVDSWSPDGKPVGRIVVHHEGQWVEVTLAGSVRRLRAD
jgi:hypothetical protein